MPNQYHLVEKSPGETTRAGEIFLYKSYEVTVVRRDETDQSPAWNDVDKRTGKRIILVLEGIERRFLIPVLEHEVYEIEHQTDHEGAVEVGRRAAEELGLADDFSEFARIWENKKNKSVKESNQ